MKNDAKLKNKEIYSQEFYDLYNSVKDRERLVIIQKYNFKLRLALALLLSLCLISLYFIKIQFENLINFATGTAQYEQGLYVHFIDVGQGKAIAVRTDDGKNFLIDCGKESEHQKLFGYLEQYFFEGKNAEKVFDYFILTHPDSDHIGNSVKVFEKYEIKNCYRPKIYTPAEAEILGITNSHQINNSLLYLNFVEALNEEKCNIHYNFAGETISGVNYSFSFLTPIQDSYSNSNSYSPIMTLTYNNIALSESEWHEQWNKKFMFTGDATLTNENETLSNYNTGQLKVDVLDISHHGSGSSSTQNFLNAVNPEYAVISVGENSYGLPADAVLERLMLSGVIFEKIYRTDKLGTIIFHINPFGDINVFNKIGSYLNLSFYSFMEIVISFELMIWIVCFLTYLPKKKQLY